MKINLYQLDNTIMKKILAWILAGILLFVIITIICIFPLILFIIVTSFIAV